MFRGRATLSLDAKGRLAVPTKYREQLAARCDGQLIVTTDSPQYLLVYPRPEWDAIEKRLTELPNANPSVKRLQRLLIGNADAVEIDGAGRILIAPELRRFAGLDKSVTLIGLGTKFELWDEAKYLSEMSEAFALDEAGPALDGFTY